VIGWREVERAHLHAGLGVELITDHDGRPPHGRIDLSIEVDAGGWRPIAARPRWIRPNLAFVPALERYRDAAGRPPRIYRVKVIAELYRPLYEHLEQPGIDIPVSAWDEANPPVPTLLQPVRIPLLPLPGVRFDDRPVLRGFVLNPNATPVVTALVEFDGHRVVTASDGEFALPMPRAPTGISLVDVAAVPSDGRADVFPVTLPNELRAKVVFTLN
jgi:hypothetical protein